MLTGVIWTYMTDFEDWYGVDITKEPEKSGLCSVWLGDTHEEIYILRSKAEAFKGAHVPTKFPG